MNSLQYVRLKAVDPSFGYRPDLRYARRPAAAIAAAQAVMTSMSSSHYFDRIAIALSGVCIVHCLAVPLLAAVLPIAFAGLDEDLHFHEWMLWGVVPTSLFGLGMGLRYHRRKWIPTLGAVGLVIVAYAAIVAHGAWAWWQELSLSIIGSVLLVAAHWRNFVEVRLSHTH